MIQLLQLGAAARVARKAAHMADVDPSGLTLTLVSVSVVFCALIILFIAYSIIGKFFTGQKKSSGNGLPPQETAAAIAVAMDLYLSGGETADEEVAAIAAALGRYIEDEAVHDIESGIITIKR